MKADLPRIINVASKNFNIHIEKSKTEFCIVEKIVINGIEIPFCKLGKMKDIDEDNAPPCGCKNRVFIPVEPYKILLNELKINEEQYKELSEILKKKLTIGECRRCK